jgi:hypothetical protein
MSKSLRGIGAGLVKFIGSVLGVVTNSDGYIDINGKRFYALTTTVAAGDATSAPAGSIGVTTYATGLRQLFVSDGTYWQDYPNQESVITEVSTIATTSTTDAFTAAPFAGKLIGAVFIGKDALAANDTNYITFTLTNLGQAGAGSTALLAATNPNTTKVTGGTALGANTRRDLTLHGTAGNLVVAQHDRLKLTATATGTLANTITNGTLILIWQRTV